MKAGRYNVVYGKVPNDLDIGDGNVIIGATDEFGNVDLRKPMTLGFAAQGSPGAITIGAFAGSNQNAAKSIAQFVEATFSEPLVSQEDKNKVMTQASIIEEQMELPKAQRSLNLVQSALKALETVASIGGGLATIWQTLEPTLNQIFS